MKPLDFSDEKVEIRDFLVIKSAVFKLGNIGAIIGPQASGKSIIAKVIFFGRNYMSRFLRAVVLSNYSTRAFKHAMVDDFLELFGQLDGFDKPFSVDYSVGEFQICISRDKLGRKPKIIVSKQITALGTSFG